jgi:LysM repeat protein
VIAGGLALVLSIVALVKLSTLQKSVATHEEAISSKIPALEASVSAATSKSEADVKSLRSGIQTALDQVGNEIGTINGKLAKMEEAMKKPAPAAAGKGGAAAAPTGVLNADGTYTVAGGDTLSKIARKFGTKVDSIQAENPGLDTIRPGQKIRIPKK